MKKLNNPNLANILIKHWDSHSPVVEIVSNLSLFYNFSISIVLTLTYNAYLSNYK